VPEFTCSMSQPGKAFPHFWEHTVGNGHAPLALRADWQDQVLRVHDELGFSMSVFTHYFRTKWERSYARKKNFFIPFLTPIKLSTFFCR
jgi:hypothetical protein